MGIFDSLKKAFPAADRVTPGRSAISPMLVPVGLSPADYVRLYGEVGWLFGCGIVRAQSVSEPGWHLYAKKSNGEREEIFDHPLLSLFDFVNPFQTRVEFFQTLDLYLFLTGDAFIILNYNRAGVPAEMWVAPPSQMEIIPSENEFIAGYYLKTGREKQFLARERVIHIKHPSPFDVYRGMGNVQAIGTDLRSERLASKMTEKQFYNDAVLGTILSSEQIPPKNQRDEIRDQWNSEHQGWRNIGRTAFLWGGLKAQRIALTNTEIDLANLRRLNRDIILGACRTPLSILGVTGENGSRARVEGDEYVYSRRVIKPTLVMYREAFNEQLCPLFDDKLEFDFDDPVPQNTDSVRLDLESGVKTGYMKINEARAAKGLPPDPLGEAFLWQVQQSIPVISPPEKTAKRIKNILETEAEREAFWERYVTKAESYEKDLILSLQAMFTRQMDEALLNLQAGKTELLDPGKLKAQYRDAVTLPLTRLIREAKQDAENLVAPENGKTIRAEPQDEAAIRWLKTRITWAAIEVGDETASELAKTLAEGYSLGESMDKLADRVKAVFTFASDTRAMRIARTETIAASNQGAVFGYKEAGVNRTEWWAARDERLCELCNTLHGQKNDIGEGFVPPAHVNCRCVLLPVIED